MVFHLSLRSTSEPAHAKNLKPSLPTLPPEILLQILSSLPTLSVLKLRASCRGVVDACNGAIQMRLRTLFIHPTRTSLRQAVEICAHPVFSQEVTAVVLLGKVLWRDIEKAHPEYRGATQEVAESHHLPDRTTRFRNWPLAFPCAARKEVVQGLQDRVDQPLTSAKTTAAFLLESWSEAYRPLIDALAKLPRLTRLEFADSVERPGFNQTSELALISHAKKCAGSPGPREGNRRADSEVFYNLLLDDRLRFTEVRLGAELPFGEDMLTPLQAGGLRPLTSIELTIDNGWPWTQRHDLYQQLIASSQDILERLKITWVPDAAVKKPFLGDHLVQLPNAGDVLLPKLRCFELKLLPNAPADIRIGKISSSKPASGSDRPQRPVCQRFDMAGFLERHLDSLFEVSFTNIIFSGPASTSASDSMVSSISAPQTIRNVLAFLKNSGSTTLNKFEW